jgi:hypothetical protein
MRMRALPDLAVGRIDPCLQAWLTREEQEGVADVSET